MAIFVGKVDHTFNCLDFINLDFPPPQMSYIHYYLRAFCNMWHPVTLLIPTPSVGTMKVFASLAEFVSVISMFTR